VIFALIVAVLAKRVRYDGYSLIRAQVNPDQVDELKGEYPELDVWLQRETFADLLISPKLFPAVSAKVNFEMVTENIQPLIDEQYSKKRLPWTTKNEFFETFRTYAEFNEYIDELIALYPSLLTKNAIGRTIQGNVINSLKLTTGGNKPAIYIEGTIHAREWLAPTTALFTLVSLLEGYAASDPIATRLVTNIEWHFVVFLNIDGYLYTWSNDRLWRKNRRQNVGGTYGVDLNRNWGPANTWCTSGSSTVPSSDTYCGTAPFSEPETSATSNAELLVANMTAVIAFHTYGPLLLRPYQYTYNQPPEPYNSLATNLGQEMETAINAVHNARYESIQGSSLYPHSGGNIDWSYLMFNVPAYTIEIRGNSFIVPDSEIILAGEENYQGVIVLAHHVLGI